MRPLDPRLLRYARSTRGFLILAVVLGARAEYRFTAPAPRNGTDSAHAEDDELDEYLHLFMSNRGVLMTPFHNMALMCPGPEKVGTKVPPLSDSRCRCINRTADTMYPWKH